MTKSITIKMTTIFDIILKEISGTEAKEFVLGIIKVAIINKAIAEAITNFLKTRLIHSF